MTPSPLGLARRGFGAEQSLAEQGAGKLALAARRRAMPNGIRRRSGAGIGFLQAVMHRLLHGSKRPSVDGGAPKSMNL